MTPARPAHTTSASLFLCFVAVTACGGPKGPIDGSAAYAHVQRMVGFGPRPYGSDALGKTADYIVAEVGKLGLKVERHELMHDKEKKLIRNLYVQIDGEDPQNGPILMIGGHYDTKLAEGHTDAAHNFPFVGAIDGGGAPGVLIELARVLKQAPQKPKVNVWLYWIDAEESLDWRWNNDRALLGSKAFCKMLADTKTLARVKAFVLLDLIGSKNHKIDFDGNSDGKLQAIFERAGGTIGESKRMYEFPTQQERAYYQQKKVNWGTTDDHMTFRGYGVPSVLLIDFFRRIPPHLQELPAGQPPEIDPRYTQWWHTADDDMDQVDPNALAFAGNLVMAAFSDLEAYCLARK